MDTPLASSQLVRIFDITAATSPGLVPPANHFFGIIPTHAYVMRDMIGFRFSVLTVR